MILRTKKEDIIDWLENYKIRRYNLIPDEKYGFVVNVDGSVVFTHKNLKFIEVKFNEVYSDFNCSHNQLVSLLGSPEKILDGGFYCGHNSLTSLEHAPKSVLLDFACHRNKLVSLVGCPREVTAFFCSHNELKSLRHGPISVLNTYDCSHNNLESLEFSPQYVGEEFLCNDNSLKNLDCLPKKINSGYIKCSNNPKLDFLQDINKIDALIEAHNIFKHKKELENKLYSDGINTRNKSKI